eukprot:TRINITY_DN28139_c0_g1_i1.p2 TRINITY_DN28139_c0_g1~~TRINITY_DN28139_c0_g1_i1.p2  ORF type:complete len:373 (+),score=131.12 TRINITY_DN28139_c0_g1_i1:106-1224(+)
MLRVGWCGARAVRYASAQAEEVAFEMGRMVAHCSGQHAFKEQFKRVLRETPPLGRGVFSSEPAWKVVNPEAKQAATGEVAAEAEPYVPRFVGLDVEMIERRTNREKVPIKGALVESVFWKGTFHRRESTWLIDPLVDLSPNAFDWKTETHGITYDTYMQQRPQAVSLASVQDQVAAAVRSRGSCMVGHMLLNDLMALRLMGTALRNRIIDTAYYFGPRADGGANSLSDVVRTVASQCDDGAEGTNLSAFRTKAKAQVHEPLEDAAIAVDIAEAEMTRLLDGGQLPVLRLPKPSSTVAVFMIQISDVRAFIGPGGANLKKVKHETGSQVVVCTMSMPSALHYVVTVTSSNPIVHPATVKLVKEILPGRLYDIT